MALKDFWINDPGSGRIVQWKLVPRVGEGPKESGL